MKNTLDILSRSFRCIGLPQRTPPRGNARLCGVYMLTLENTITYIGSSVHVIRRVWHHGVDNRNSGDRKVFKKDFDGVIWYPLPQAVHHTYEGAFIRFINPRHNIGDPPGNAEYDDEIIDGFGLDPRMRPIPEELVSHKRRQAESTEGGSSRFRPSTLVNDRSRRIHNSVIFHVKKSGLSIGELATSLGCSQKRVSRLLDGTTRISAQDIEDLSNILCIPVADLFRDIESDLTDSN